MPPLLLGIYDSQQKVHCEFMADAAGDLRCLPLTPDELPNHNQFADPACRTPLFASAIFRYVSATEPVSIPLSTGSACDKARHSVGRLTSLPAGSARYARDQQGSCVASSSEPGGPAVVLVDMPLGSWQAGSETAGALLTQSLRLSEVETADGARFPSALVDERWAQPCALAAFDSDHVACWPTGALRGGLLYSDVQCQSQLWRGDGCVTASFGTDGSSLFSLLPYTGPVFEGGGHGCFAWDAHTDTAAAYFSRGEQLAGDVLATARWRVQGSGRFQHRVLEDDQGRPVEVVERIWQGSYASLRIEDREKSEPCQIFWTDSGVRCLPDAVYVNTVSTEFEFADAECTEPAYLCPKDSCDGIAFMPGFRSERGHLFAEPLRRAKDIGNRYWARIEGVCAPGTLAALSFFRADGDVSWDAYPALSEINGEP